MCQRSPQARQISRDERHNGTRLDGFGSVQLRATDPASILWTLSERDPGGSPFASPKKENRYRFPWRVGDQELG